MPKRPLRAHIAISHKERKMLLEVGEKLGLRPSDTFRTLLRREHERLFASRAPAMDKAVA